jgi:hypothetical protein
MSTAGTSPNTLARIGGALYLLIIACGVGAMLLFRGPLVVSGDAAATAMQISGSLFRWRAGIAGDVIMHMCDIGVMLAFYVLLRPVNAQVALFALLSNVVQTSVLMASKLNLLLPVYLLGDAAYLGAFSPEQLQALSYVALRMHNGGFALGLVFFGMTCIANGYLIIRARYLPKVLGIGMQLAGLCYLVNSFAQLLAPTLAALLVPAILLPPFLAELSMALWLLLKGVDLSQWQAHHGQRAGA